MLSLSYLRIEVNVCQINSSAMLSASKSQVFFCHVLGLRNSVVNRTSINQALNFIKERCYIRRKKITSIGAC